MREECLAARKALFNKLYKEVVGPGSGETLENGTPCSLPDEEHELITDLPEERYYVGVLYPAKDNKMNADNDTSVPDTGGKDDEMETESAVEEEETHGDLAAVTGVNDDTMDEVIALSTQDRPSSVGITFVVGHDIDDIVVDVSFATYRHAVYTDCGVPYGKNIAPYVDALDEYVYPDGSMMRLKHSVNGKDVRWLLSTIDPKDDGTLARTLYKLAAQCNPRKAFVRIPHSESVVLTLDGKPVNVCGVGFAYMRAVKSVISDRTYTITIMLYNGGTGHYDGTNTIFQPKIEVASAKNPFMRALAYDDNMRFPSDDEEHSLALLYRNRKRYATGHGISAYWDISGFSWCVRTDLMPWTEVPQMDFEFAFRRGVEKKSLSLKYLSDLSPAASDEKLTALGQLISAYESWIDDLDVSSLENVQLRKIADKHVASCRDAAKRMREGLECLQKNADAMRAFSLANRAMFMQMKHRDKVQHVPDDEDPSTVPYRDIDYETLDMNIHSPDFCIWRPFQIAFFLMNIRGLTDTDPHPDETEETERDRNIVDIIWFSTGGGKTEAYLALTAFVIFYRRLKYPDASDGTAVLMRYTLRLLTSQQFARASTLICACDRIRLELWNNSRRRDKRWKEPITIGLWIGGDHTPNKNSSSYPKGAKELSRDLKNPGNGSLEFRNDYYNKFQVLTCPWCGASLVPTEKSERLNGEAAWGYQTDDHGRFYIKCVRPGCPYEKGLPVQVVDEELYRIPPTLLFATVDKFAMIAWNKNVGNFFGLDTNNRTPELIVQDELHLISGPLGSIVGLYETAIDLLCSSKGIRPKIVASTATIRRAGDQCRRLYNRTARQFPPAGLDASDSFFAKEAETDVKPGRLYVGVFPSGKTKAMLQTKVMSTLLQYVNMLDGKDNIKDQYWTLTAYFNSLRDLGKCSGLVDDDIKDFMKRLCRRIATDKIIRRIAMADELTSRVPTTALVKCLKKLEKTTYSKENQEAGNYAVNVLLATNMISVGVDVDRLNLMAVVGQPKLTSEYIQATSRIGRKNPGLVCVLYDATKSRDRSHFEQFHAYHESFYRDVEPTSVTPFSQPALDRALHAVLVGLARHCDGSLYNDADARNFTLDFPSLDHIKKEVLRRIDSISRHSQSGEGVDLNAISAQIDAFFESWAARTEAMPEADQLYYGQRFMTRLPGANEHRLLRPFGTWSNKDPANETLTSMRTVDQTLSSRMLIWEEGQN